MGFDPFPLLLTLRIAVLATAGTALLGTLLGWILARRTFPGQHLLTAAISLPLVLPPTVLGYYLLVALGRRSPLGTAFEHLFGFPLIFTWWAALLAAVLHGFPFMVHAAGAAIAEVDPACEEAARTMGASEWQILWRVTLPLARRGLASGATLVLARTFGDFGVTLMVAGDIPDRTQTAAVAIYDAILSGDEATAWKLVAILTAASLAILYGITRLGQDTPARRRAVPRAPRINASSGR